jgi:hypothetical protein
MAVPTFRSIDNPISLPDVSLALEHLLIAPYGTSWTPGLVNISSPPAGFLHIGAVTEDSPQLQVTKQFYQLQTGIPKVLRYTAVVGLQGDFQCVAISNRNTRAYWALGGLPPYHLPNTPAGGFSYVHSVVDRTSVLVNSTAMAAAIVAGQIVVTDTSANILSTLNEAFVSSIAAVTGNTLYQVTLFGPDYFPALPVQSQPFFVEAHQRYAMGSEILPSFHLLGVADFLSGEQIIHDMAFARPKAQFQDLFRNANEVRVSMMFDLFGYSVSTPYDSVNSHLIVAERFIFPPNSPGL